MSAVSEVARLTVSLADFAMQDASGKVNMIGDGITLVGFDAARGTTARFTVVGRIMVPSALCPVEATVELALYDAAGDLVVIPGVVQEQGQAVRLGQVVKLERPNAPGRPMLPDAVPQSHVFIIDLNNGLPLRTGDSYRWSLRVDGDEERAVGYTFAVTGPPSAPVFG